MHRFEKKKSKNFFPEGPGEHVFEGPAKMFPCAPLWLSTGLPIESVLLSMTADVWWQQGACLLDADSIRVH